MLLLSQLTCNIFSNTRLSLCCFFFQAEDGIRDFHVTGVQTCALPILAGDACCRFLIFGIHCELFWSELCESAEHGGSAAGRVFVEVEPNFSGATLRGGFVGFAFEDGGANGQLDSHRRILIALRWASRPSASAKVSAESARRRKPFREI